MIYIFKQTCFKFISVLVAMYSYINIFIRDWENVISICKAVVHCCHYSLKQSDMNFLLFILPVLASTATPPSGKTQPIMLSFF